MLRLAPSRFASLACHARLLTNACAARRLWLQLRRRVYGFQATIFTAAIAAAAIATAAIAAALTVQPCCQFLACFSCGVSVCVCSMYAIKPAFLNATISA